MAAAGQEWQVHLLAEQGMVCPKRPMRTSTNPVQMEPTAEMAGLPKEKDKARQPHLPELCIHLPVVARLMRFLIVQLCLRRKPKHPERRVQAQGMLMQMAAQVRLKVQVVAAPLAYLPPTLGQVQAQQAV